MPLDIVALNIYQAGISEKKEEKNYVFTTHNIRN